MIVWLAVSILAWLLARAYTARQITGLRADINAMVAGDQDAYERANWRRLRVMALTIVLGANNVAWLLTVITLWLRR